MVLRSLWFVLGLVVSAGAAGAQTQPDLRTAGEQASFARPTAHDELLSFLYDVQARTDRVRIVNLARTDDGRVMPLVILGSPPAASPAAALLSRRPTVLITGNVHGSERAGREGSLQLIRDLAVGAAQPLLERVNVLVVPTLNPDGAERRTRTNALGYDMNRDFVVAETPEIRALLEDVLLEWWPDVYVDVHNGGAYPYHLTYQATLHPGADSALVAFARGPLYEAVRAHLRARGMDMFWYSGPRRDSVSGAWTWQTTEPWARKQHSYAGLQNMIALLYEIPGRWTLAQQADNAREGLLGLLAFVAERAQDVRATVADARWRTVAAPPDRVVVKVRQDRYPQPEQFYVLENDQPRLVSGENRTRYVASVTRARPWAYAFDAHLNRVAAFLRRHDIQVERLEAPADLATERYRLTRIEWATTPYQGHLHARAQVEVTPAPVTLPAGTYLVRMNQNAARLIAELMEPDTEDSILVWNFLDNILPAQRTLETTERPFYLPIYRIMAPAAVRATLID